MVHSARRISSTITITITTRSLYHTRVNQGVPAPRVVPGEPGSVTVIRGLFQPGEPTRSGGMVWNAAASALTKLRPGESRDVLRETFDLRTRSSLESEGRG